MKTLQRILGLSAMLLLIASVASAQFAIGARGGVHFAKTDYGDFEELDDSRELLIGPQAAFVVEWKLTDYFALQAEPGYIQKGEKFHFEEEGPDVEGHITVYDADLQMRLHYLTMPVLAKGMIGSDNLHFYAIAGPEMGYAISGKHKMEFTISNGQIEDGTVAEDVDFNEEGIDRFDLSLIFGAGVEAKIGMGALFLDGRYNLGLYDIDRDKNVEGETYNRGFGFSLGYLVPIGQ